MQAFDYCNPTRVVFGCGRISQLGEIASQYGNKVLFLTYDREIVEKIGLLHKAMEPMEAAGLTVLTCFGVKSNPSLFHARSVLEQAACFRPDLIVALGGGSVIDEAKCIGAAYCTGVDIWEMVQDNSKANASLPLIAVSTIPATSSEMNNIAVISNDATGRKDGIENFALYPKVALLDPELTRSIPIRQTAYSAADIVSHLLEGYLSHSDPFVPMQNRYFDAMIKTQMDCMERLLAEPTDIQARSMMMWAATYSWNGFCVLGIGPFESMIHALGHILSEMYDTPHGATMAIFIPAIMSFHVERRKERFARIARNVFGVEDDDDLWAARKGIIRMRQWLDHIGAPSSFTKGGIPTHQLQEIVERCYQNVIYYGSGDDYSKEDVRRIIELAL